MNAADPNEIKEAARARRQAIRECRLCDSEGWLCGTDRLPLDPARRCRHDAPPEFPRYV